MAISADKSWFSQIAGISDALEHLPQLGEPGWAEGMSAMADFSPVLEGLPEFEMSSTPEDTLAAVTRSAEQAQKQTELLSALNVLSDAQVQTLSALNRASQAQAQTLVAMRKLSEDLASERRRSVAREDIQQGFNRRMSWAALLLAGAAVIVPFGILLIEQAMS